MQGKTSNDLAGVEMLNLNRSSNNADDFSFYKHEAELGKNQT